MGGSFPTLEIIILAVLAGLIFLRLRSVLGRRTGTERHDRYRADRRAEGAESGNDNVVKLPRGPEGDAERAAGMAPYVEPGTNAALELTKVQLADRTFDPARFIEGAKLAYETIVEGFARGDKDALKGLLHPNVFTSFAAAIDQRQQQGLAMETTLVGINGAKISTAALRNKAAEVTVRFMSEMITCTRNAQGEVVDGNPSAVRQVVDVWTFSRDTRSTDPNWQLIATGDA